MKKCEIINFLSLVLSVIFIPDRAIIFRPVVFLRVVVEAEDAEYDDKDCYAPDESTDKKAFLAP